MTAGHPARWRRWAPGLIAVVALGGGVLAATPAAATVLWPNEQYMIDHDNERSSFVVDPGRTQTISPEAFAEGPVSDFFQRQGFDRNFLRWAPIAAEDPPPELWKRCLNNHGGICADSDVRDGQQLVSAEFGSGTIRLKRWDRAFIGIVCGNYNHAGSGPVPTITGTKYEDLNGNGTRDSNEGGLPGWRITVSRDGVEVGSATTDADGVYRFALDANTNAAIGAGTYTLTETMQDGWAQSAAPQPFAISLGVGPATFSGKDFGNYRPAALSGRKFEDMNADGSGAGDPGIPAWSISYAGTSSGSVATGGDGSYRISGLRPGTYTVDEEHRAGWTQSYPSTGTHTVTVTSGQTVGDLDFGNWRPATISGRKFDDRAVDGAGAGDPGVRDWGITLGSLEARTDADGSYSFAGLKPGAYTVAEVQRDHWRQTAPATGTRAVTVVSGQHLTDADFGNVCLGNVEAKVPAGVQVRLEEVNVPGILANSPALPWTATGESTLKDLLPGTYKITMLLPDDVFVTDPDLTAVDGHLAVVRTITVTNCATTEVILTPAPRSADGKVTGVGLKLPVAPKFVTSGFVFMQTGGVARGNLQVNDHAGKLVMHTPAFSRSPWSRRRWPTSTAASSSTARRTPSGWNSVTTESRAGQMSTTCAWVMATPSVRARRSGQAIFRFTE